MSMLAKSLPLICVLALAGCDLAPTDMNRHTVVRDVALYWSHPMQRINGDTLSIDEIQGYEIRYWRQGENRYTSVFIQGHSVDSYLFTDMVNPSDLTFQIAAVDQSGVYSSFVTAQ